MIFFSSKFFLFFSSSIRSVSVERLHILEFNFINNGAAVRCRRDTIFSSVHSLSLSLARARSSARFGALRCQISSNSAEKHVSSTEIVYFVSRSFSSPRRSVIFAFGYGSSDTLEASLSRSGVRVPAQHIFTTSLSLVKNQVNIPTRILTCSRPLLLRRVRLNRRRFFVSRCFLVVSQPVT